MIEITLTALRDFIKCLFYLSASGRIRILDLIITSQVVNHCATVAGKYGQTH